MTTDHGSRAVAFFEVVHPAEMIGVCMRVDHVRYLELPLFYIAANLLGGFIPRPAAFRIIIHNRINNDASSRRVVVHHIGQRKGTLIKKVLDFKLHCRRPLPWRSTWLLRVHSSHAARYAVVAPFIEAIIMPKSVLWNWPRDTCDVLCAMRLTACRFYWRIELLFYNNSRHPHSLATNLARRTVRK